MSTHTEDITPHSHEWWRQAAVYQIYPRSFADADGDGIGDLEGIISRVNYLSELGVDAVWLSPFYRSPLADGGYDVQDHRAVDPRLGTLDHFDQLVARMHAAGIKVIIDIVPNHSSHLHPWFQQALATPKGSPERARYVFRDGTGVDGTKPPTDWVSMFGGPAWTAVGDGQFYLHLYSSEQPDFDWANQDVRRDFENTLRFWADRGVDGFRVDVANALYKRLDEPLPLQRDLILAADGSHPLWDQPEVHEIYKQWRTVLNEYDPPRSAVAEAWVPSHRRVAYASAQGLGQAFNFDLLEADFDAAQFKEIITTNLALAAQAGSSSTWVLSNHDVVRHTTRYGLPPRAGAEVPPTRHWLLSRGSDKSLDAAAGLKRARAATLLMLALPGSAYLYQGEELGLPEVTTIPDEQRQDPTFFRSPGVDVGRDGCRIPLPWESTGPSLGFGQSQPHLPQPPEFAPLSVAAQLADDESTLQLYRRALHTRRQLQITETLTWSNESNTDVLDFTRPGGWRCVTNFSAEPVELPSGTILLSSAPVENRTLPPHSTAWLQS